MAKSKKNNKAAKVVKKAPAKTAPKKEAPAKKTAEALLKGKDTVDTAALTFEVKQGTRTDYAPKKPKVAPAIKSAAITMPSGEGEVSHNRALVVFPSDPWGLTKDLRTALTNAASRIGGAPDKKALIEETLLIGIQHIEAKFKVDEAYRAKLVEDAKVAE